MPALGQLKVLTGFAIAEGLTFPHSLHFGCVSITDEIGAPPACACALAALATEHGWSFPVTAVELPWLSRGDFRHCQGRGFAVPQVVWPTAGGLPGMCLLRVQMYVDSLYVSGFI